MRTILIVDDEQNMQSVLRILFQSKGYKTKVAANGCEALEVLSGHDPVDLVISDLKMPEMDGIALLKEINILWPALPFILITAYGTIERAVEAMKLGAVDFITKPFNKELILHTLDRIWEFHRLERENKVLKEDRKEHDMIFRSSGMRDIVSTIRKVADISSPVLLTGESGSGKEVVARTIHNLGRNSRSTPFVSINCPAVPESLFESELFGFRKGAFTGAESDFPGKVRMAEGGTLFLDEIGDLPLSIQPKLLRLLENKTIEPLGTGKTLEIDVRIICATNRDLETLVRQGLFRSDLFYRINTFHLKLPALKDRTADIVPLAEYFLDKFAVELGTGERMLSLDALDALESYSWPGNVRELRNVLERTVVLSSGEVITAVDLPGEITCGTAADSLETSGEVGYFNSTDASLYDMERRVLLDSLEEADGNISAAARKLGITRNTMRYRLKKFGLITGAYAPEGDS